MFAFIHGLCLLVPSRAIQKAFKKIMMTAVIVHELMKTYSMQILLEIEGKELTCEIS